MSLCVYDNNRHIYDNNRQMSRVQTNSNFSIQIFSYIISFQTNSPTILLNIRSSTSKITLFTGKMILIAAD